MPTAGYHTGRLKPPQKVFIHGLSQAGAPVCREVAGKAYGVWAEWAASALAADLSAALQADAALASNVVLRSWEEVIVPDTLQQVRATSESSSFTCSTSAKGFQYPFPAAALGLMHCTQKLPHAVVSSFSRLHWPFTASHQSTGDSSVIWRSPLCALALDLYSTDCHTRRFPEFGMRFASALVVLRNLMVCQPPQCAAHTALHTRLYLALVIPLHFQHPFHIFWVTSMHSRPDHD